MKRAATIASSLKAEQDSGNINRTQSMATLNESFPQGTSSGSDPRYALTVNPTIYTSYIKQFWGTTKVQTVNEEVQIQALVDGKKVIVIEISVRRSLHLKDAKGTDSLPTATIFAELERMGYGLLAKVQTVNEEVQIQALVDGKKVIVTETSLLKKWVKGQQFLLIPITLLLNHLHQDLKRNSQEGNREKTVALQSLSLMKATYEENSDRVLALENTNTSQAAEIATLKERVKKVEKKRRSRTYTPRRLYKVSLSRRIESSDDVSLGAQEDASKQGRKIADLDAYTEVTLIDETQGRNDEDLMFDTSVLNGDEVFQESMVNIATTTSLISVSVADLVTTAGEVVTTASVEIPEELTLAQTLIEIKSTKPKAVTTTATTVIPSSSRPKAKGIAKDKGNAKMVEPEKPLKKKDQIAIDEKVARNLTTSSK
ncbi:hypothetical protein Tco_0866321 [Tanacetum coccineum]